MTFSILFWNIWLNNQIDGEAKASSMKSELKRLIDQYQPDFIGLNEVLKSKHADSPFILDYLSSYCGYKYNHYAAASPINIDWVMGVAICSKVKFNTVRSVSINKDTAAAKSGYYGFSSRVAVATFPLSRDYSLNIIVTHLLYLRSHTLKEHYAGARKLEQLIRSGKLSKNTILGGDFNEPGFMPKAFKDKVDDLMHFKTGSMLNPTWRHNANRLTPIRANLDQLFWSKNSEFELKSFKVLDSNISDHRPLLATFQYE